MAAEAKVASDNLAPVVSRRRLLTEGRGTRRMHLVALWGWVSHRLDCHFQPVARFRDRPHLPVGLVAGRQRHFEVLQEMPRKGLGLHIGKVQAETHMRAAAKWHPGKAVTV